MRCESYAKRRHKSMPVRPIAVLIGFTVAGTVWAEDPPVADPSVGAFPVVKLDGVLDEPV